MFKKIKQALATIGVKPLPPTVSATNFMVTEDERATETRKRVNKAFDNQWNQMQLKGLKPHAFDCLDPFTCIKSVCFVWDPDKTIRTFTVDRNLNEIKVTTMCKDPYLCGNKCLAMEDKKV
jgi:hypothetical protein